VTIAIRPSCGDNHIFLKNGRQIFFVAGLDTILIRRSDFPVGNDAPVQAPTKFELIANLGTAKALRFAVPPTLFTRTDDVIE